MTEERGNVPPAGTDAREAEIVEAVRHLMQVGQREAPPTTDEHGDPLPRLSLDDPHPQTDDPLLRVGYALLPQLPEGWESAQLHVTAAAETVRASAIVKEHADAPHESRFFFSSVRPDLADACLALRRSTYDPDGRGAWYNAMIRIERDGTIFPQYDFINPPFGYWGPQEAELVRRDHDLYPRRQHQLPAWHPAR